MPVGGAFQQIPPACVVLHAGVVPGGDGICTVCPCGVCERAEFKYLVAQHAGVGRPARCVLLRKIPDDGVPEQLTEIIDPVRDAQPVTHGTGIVYVAVGAAGLGLCLPGDVLLRTVQSHGCAKDIESCTLQQVCCDRAVYSAAHCRADDSDSVHSWPSPQT